MKNLYALVIAGGRGTRFWPLSRETTPKQCVEIGGAQAYLRQTIHRLLPIIPAERILLVTGKVMEQSVRALAPELPAHNILVEPWGRNTAPCIGWGAVEIGKRCAGAVMAVFPCDHQIDMTGEFHDVVRSAAAAAAATNAIITIGITPVRPETGFGYLELGPATGHWGQHDFRSVSQFVEKPSPEMAKSYVEGGTHVWNAGMFVSTVDGLRDAYRIHLPKSATALERIAHDPQSLEVEWGNLDATSIDYGIMERSRRIMTVPCEIGWSDMGSWTAVGATFPKIEAGRGIVGDAVSSASSGCIVHAPNKVVATLGVEDLVVIDTEDALLIMKKDRSQQLGDIVRMIKDKDIDGIV